VALVPDPPLGTATPACRLGLPVHCRVEPALRRLRAIAYRPMDRQPAAALERFIVGRPGPDPAGRGCGSAHASQLPRWIHEMTPCRDLYSRAQQSHQPGSSPHWKKTLWPVIYSKENNSFSIFGSVTSIE
jgi:hypothetical protein